TPQASAAFRNGSALRMSGKTDDSCRIDVWLWRARFLKTRALAAEFVDRGKVRRASLTPGGQPVRLEKPGTPIRPGDILVFALAGRPIQARIVALGERRGPAPEARGLYELIESDPNSDLEPPAV
ncbi:MAG: RNA-binding S4 domain-containing protein, partial [Caulobacterales bacterium]